MVRLDVGLGQMSRYRDKGVLIERGIERGIENRERDRSRERNKC